MINTGEFKLVSNLFDNVVILNSADRIVFRGKKIPAFFDLAQITCTEQEIKGPSSAELLKAVRCARSGKKACMFEPEAHKASFVVFPVNNESNNFVVIAPSGKIKEIHKIESDLKERIKELECLYNVSREFTVNETIVAAVQQCCDHITHGFQFPGHCSAQIELDRKDYFSSNYNKLGEVKSVLQVQIKDANNNYRGKIEVHYHRKKEKFLPEEKRLLNEIAGKISRELERLTKRRDLEKRRKILHKKNQKLLQLTRECNETQQKLRTFFMAISDNIVVIDRDFNIIMANKKEFEENKKCHKYLFNNDEVCSFCPASVTFDHKEVSSTEIRHNDKAYLLQLYPVLDENNEVERVLEVCRDISKEKEIEFQLIQSYKLASLGKLVAGVAHEINNPNTYIMGNLNIIKEAFRDILPTLDELSKKNKDMKIARLNYDVFRENISVLLEDMENGTKRVKAIIEGLRNFARKDEGLINEEVDINHLINNNLRVVKNHIRRNARLEFSLGPNIPPITGNNQKLEQVLVNMIINASQAIEHENGIISVATDFDDENQHIILKISDNGKGMDPITMKSIFDPFFTTKRNKGGTGLGLSISYGIIQEHNGWIKVDSEKGKGTTFTIVLPKK
jgi:signal transduction histidine kinase